ncbi:MAG: 30S ribosomal protein S16 [Alphaproteobacteria bacterium]|uniref:30S ribosomal protein S16 n=1 Tax=Pacificispira sp. TaxID=2888761 RepID=UPI001B0B8F05|nr:30S ribosomal protein S16 [Alphaproteobacteria bacterium]MBO6865156.1 30S ribosomal protein S16 [Alphaproteobacteria bacterium]MEC9268248.1 30S ribosomal protein S16 [Pseudomonadota bacterium]
MSLKIRMSRGGAKKRPFYRIVVADSRAPRDGRFIEKIGFHNPMVDRDHEERLKLDLDRARHWLSVGAKPSPRVHRFLAEAGVLEKAAIPEQTKKNLPKAKEQERIREREEKAREAAEAAAAAEAEAAAPAEEAPAEEAASEEASA